MPKASPAVVNFNGGEVGPLLGGRVDYEKYATSCHRMRRFIPTVQGPAKRCPGTRHVLPTRDSADRAWLIRFAFAYDQAYILEFGDGYVRFYTDRGVVLEASQAISAISQANPGVLTYVGADPANGDWFRLSGIVGMTELNGRYVQVANVNAGANTYELTDTNGANIDTTAFTAYSSGGIMRRVYTLTSPYAVADLTNGEGGCALSVTQSGDVLYIACEGYQPRTLSRLGATNWSFATYDPDDGPYQDQNIDESLTVYSSAVTGAVTLTSSAALFEAAHVGMLIRLEPVNNTIQQWEVTTAAIVGDFRRFGANVYECMSASGANTGTVPPTHTSGTAKDGSGTAWKEWQYLHSGYGVARITGFTNSTTVSATVLSRMPADVVGAGNPTWRWRFGAWGAATTGEWPAKTTFFRDRLCWAGQQRIWMSVAGDYESHAPDEFGVVLPDSAISLTVSIGSVDKIRWLRATDALLVGTAGAELAISEITTSQALGPENVKFELQSAEGSREVEPELAEDGVLFVRVGGRRIDELRFDFDSDGWVPRDMNALYPEITRGGVIAVALQKEPDDILWCVRADGVLLGLTYDRAQNVFGWHQHTLGGTDAAVEAVQVITGPAGDVEDVWMIVRRTIGGATRRYVEYLAESFEDGDDPATAIYLDSSLEYDGSVNAALTPDFGATVAGTTNVAFTAGSAAFAATDVGRHIVHRYQDGGLWMSARAVITGYTSTTVVRATILSAFPSLATIAANSWAFGASTVTGLWHLEGHAVTALADGSPEAPVVVAGGSITLSFPAGRVQAGLLYQSLLATQRIEAGSADGTAQGKTKRIHRIVLRLYASLGGNFGPAENRLDLIPYRRGSDHMDEPPPALTGDTDSLAWPGGYETDGRVWVMCDQPLPFTLVAAYPQLVTSDRG